jgi:hypothetical protein
MAAAKPTALGLSAVCSDALMGSLGALITGFYVVTTFMRTGQRGHPRKPRCESHLGLGYGQWVNQTPQDTLLMLSRHGSGWSFFRPSTRSQDCTCACGSHGRCTSANATVRFVPDGERAPGNGGRLDGSRLGLA